MKPNLFRPTRTVLPLAAILLFFTGALGQVEQVNMTSEDSQPGGSISGDYVSGLTIQAYNSEYQGAIAYVTASTDPFGRNILGSNVITSYGFSDGFNLDVISGSNYLNWEASNGQSGYYQLPVLNGQTFMNECWGTASQTDQVIGAPGVSAAIDPSGWINASYSSATDSADITYSSSASAFRGDEIFSALGDEGASIYSDDSFMTDNLYVKDGQTLAYLGSFGYGLGGTGSSSADYASWAAGQGALSQALSLTSGAGSFAVSLDELSKLGMSGPVTFEMDQQVFWDGYGGYIAGPQLIAQSWTQTNFSPQGVPEPFTTVLGVAGVGLALRRRRRSVACGPVQVAEGAALPTSGERL